MAHVHDEVAKVIDEVVRPLVEADGGRIELVGVDEDAVTVRLSAACGGCPGAPYTRAQVIEPAIKAALGRHLTVKLERAPKPVLASAKRSEVEPP